VGFRSPIGPVQISTDTRVYVDGAGTLIVGGALGVSVIAANDAGLYDAFVSGVNGVVVTSALGSITLTGAGITYIDSQPLRINGRQLFTSTGNQVTTTCNTNGDVTVTMPAVTAGHGPLIAPQQPRSFVVTFMVGTGGIGPYTTIIQAMSATQVRFRTYDAANTALPNGTAVVFCWLAVYDNV
jgi:hypothetical protein